MKLSELLAAGQAVFEKEGDIEVLARYCGDYLKSGPTLHVEERVRYKWSDGWVEPEPCYGDEVPETPLERAFVVFIEH